ncbi:hypothetical protein HZR84_08360 [Hyphobacterium sp. CCMP332]|nr:hypothetical protein HZR84_08360 [Hyphobacterium sp. CCMP332]
MKNWQVVFKSDNSHRAEIVRAILDEKELNPVLINKKDSNYHFGLFEICVAPDNVIRALKIIDNEIKFE